ncbi:basic secretory protein-like protein [Microcoleus sp. Pol12B5]|uniref:basic secretory protein-like protein n=1 Tax=Microcoleus sp. Pol12B5 TaxID=3055396 RepID=UPI002FD273FB
MNKYIALVLAAMTVSLNTTSYAKVFDTTSKSSLANTKNSNLVSTNDVHCEIDRTEVDKNAEPKLVNFANNLPDLCKKKYPEIKRLLVKGAYQPPSNIQIIFKNGKGAAHTVGNEITLFIPYFKQQSNDYGAVVHEMVHVAQNYQKSVPGWLVEGIADYIRFEMGYSDSSKLSCHNNQHYSSSVYSCAPAFVTYIEKTNNGVIAKLNAALRQEGYNNGLLSKYTGKTVEQLWQECRKNDCQGGAAHQ